MPNVCIDIDARDVQFLEQDFENDITECCTKHMPVYQKLKEGLPKTMKKFCKLNNEMLTIANKILRKIDIVGNLVSSTGSTSDVIKVTGRKHFVSGVKEQLVADARRCP